jgi:hypothetical protein
MQTTSGNVETKDNLPPGSVSNTGLLLTEVEGYREALNTLMPVAAELGSKMKLWLVLAVYAATEWPQQPGCGASWTVWPGPALTTPSCPGVLRYQALVPPSNQISSAPPVVVSEPMMLTLPLLASMTEQPQLTPSSLTRSDQLQSKPGSLPGFAPETRGPSSQHCREEDGFR